MTSGYSFWDREIVAPTHQSWMAHPDVREYINRRISGSAEGCWPLDWLQQSVLHGRSFERGLSIGCGTGAMERDLVRRGICRRVDAIDGSIGSLAVARAEADAVGMSESIHYYAADFNRPAFPSNRYDFVVFHQSLHHVDKLEKLMWALVRAMKPDAMLYLDEFIGPSRFEWNDRRMAWYRALYEAIPREFRLLDSLPLPVQYDDLSEATRSAEIISRVKIAFEVTEMRSYGGNILAVLYAGLNLNTAPDEWVRTMIRAEETLLASGEPPFYALVVARPKRGLATKAYARVRYFFEPKVKRVMRELGIRR